MENLSPETVHHILGYLGKKKDIESLRLVQKSFAILGKEFLFHTINIWPTRASLTRFHALSRRSDLALQIRCLVLNVVYDTKSLIWSGIKGHLHRLDTCHGPIRVSYEHNIKVFRDAAIECYDFLTSRDHVSILMASLFRLPRLEAVHMRDDENESYYVTAKEETIYFGDWGIHNYAGEPGSLVDPNSYFAIEALRALLEASRYTDTKIVSFQTSNDIPQVIFENPTLLNGFAGLVRNCRDLQLRFDTEDHEKVIFHLLNNPPAIIFLSTNILETLSLNFSVRPDITVPFAKLLGNQQISPYLKDINFVGIDMHERELRCFLGLHRKSLRRFSIQYSKLFSGHWLSMAVWIRENLRLESVGFAGITDSDADETTNMTEEEAARCQRYVKRLEEYVMNGISGLFLTL